MNTCLMSFVTPDGRREDTPLWEAASLSKRSVSPLWCYMLYDHSIVQRGTLKLLAFLVHWAPCRARQPTG